MNIAIIGGGTGGSKILKLLSQISSVDIKKVIDKNLDAPGIKLAKEMGISISQNIDDIATDNVDIIIEVTGNENVSKMIYERYKDKCNIIDAAGALLMIEIANHDAENLQKLDKKLQDINSTTSIVQSQMESILGSVQEIHNVSDRLIALLNVSNNYIKQSDEIIEYVNNIAMQTKVLGINATIEAARAGEHGRTFSVVAKEIQDLASSSEVYAKDINSILTKLSEEIKKLNSEVNSLEELSENQIKASEKVKVAINSLQS